MTAGGSAVDPPLLVMEPERSNTNDIISLPRVAWAPSLTEKVCRFGNIRMKNVLMVAVAVTLTSVWP